MDKKIESWILNGSFDRVKKLMAEVDFMIFEEAFITAAHRSESVLYYTFIVELMKDEETVNLHDLAFLLLVYPLSDLADAYSAAHYHAKRSVEMTESKEVKSLLQLLFLYAIPEPVLSHREAYMTAKAIVTLDPQNKVARELLKKAAKQIEAVVVDISDIKNA